MQIRVVENEAEFLLLKKDWDKLAKNLVTVNSFDWTFTWWKYYKSGNDLKILVVSQNDSIVAIVPLYIKNITKFKVFKFKKICFLGGDLSDFLDILIAEKSDKESIFSFILEYIMENINHDYIGLGQINSAYPNFPLWEKYSKLLNFEFESYRECTRRNITQYKSYKEFFDDSSKNLRKDLRRLTNKVEREIEKVEYVFKKDITQEDIDIIANININRQKFLAKKGANDRFCYFTDPNKYNFIADFFCNGNKNDKMFAYMKFNGKIVAYDIVLLNPKMMSFWNGTFDLDYEIFSPSKLLTNELVKHAFENGYEYFDFMRGSDAYKFQWIDEKSLNYNLRKRKSLTIKIAYSIKSLLPEPMFKKFFNKPDTAVFNDNL